ncbi:27996_t:CDS:2 [Dentiscutata erythropus]|uniref:27996_t:CDS:1 n=1 Tax=Dentiscutata erythropus TaxID=1348616 RepID=A0A9N9BCT6_9GLOM|nr:27996_t:CDS:2 [Dentiscutata erythropus]
MGGFTTKNAFTVFAYPSSDNESVDFEESDLHPSQRPNFCETKEGKCIQICGLPPLHVPLSEYICFRRCMKPT